MFEKRKLAACWLLSVVFIVMLCGTAWCQDAAGASAVEANVWQLVPADSLLVVAYDGRPENPTMQAVLKSVNKEQLERQRQALKLATERFATLFGVSLDFARDIDPWAGDQWAFVLLPADKDKAPGQPAFILVSRDDKAADAALAKIIAPWERIGEISQSTAAGPCTVRKFRSKDGKLELFAAACGPVVAVSPSMTALTAALAGKGFAPDSAGAKIFDKLAGSAYYVYAGSALAEVMMPKKTQIPVQGVGLGISATDTGTRLRILGLPSEQAAVFVGQLFPNVGDAAAAANEGIPAASLAVATVPDLKGAMGVASIFGGQNQFVELLTLLGDTQISVAVTAALPLPSGVISAAAESEQAAVQKAAGVAEWLKKSNCPAGVAPQIPGLQVNCTQLSNKTTLLWAQKGKYLLVATDQLSLANAAAATDNGQSITEVTAYQETMAGLGQSNIQTVYVNLAPVQGVGYLIEGIGLDQWYQPYDKISDYLKDVQALGFGLGFDGEALSATFFLRARPGVPGTVIPATTAIAAAVVFPVFARAREAAQLSSCQANLKQLATSLRQYADDHNGRMPSRTNWRSELAPYLGREVSDLEESNKRGTRYAYNKNLGGLNIKNILNPDEVVMFFETNKTDLPGGSGSRADVALTHGSGCFAYVNGFVRALQEVPAQYHWVPKYKGSSKQPVKPAQTKKK